MQKPKVRGQQAPGLLVALARHVHKDCGTFFDDGLEAPSFGAHKAMCRRLRIISLGAKPWKANRDSPADRFAFFPARLRAQKENLIASSRPPGSHLCTMQIHLAIGAGASDLDSRQTAVPLRNSGHAWNSEPTLK